MTPDASFTVTAVSQWENDAMNGNVTPTASGLVLGAALIAATASDLAAAGARPAPRSTEGTCTYRGVIFPNGVTGHSTARSIPLPAIPMRRCCRVGHAGTAAGAIRAARVTQSPSEVDAVSHLMGTGWSREAHRTLATPQPQSKPSRGKRIEQRHVRLGNVRDITGHKCQAVHLGSCREESIDQG
jgi:hypothetical protein